MIDCFTYQTSEITLNPSKGIHGRSSSYKPYILHKWNGTFTILKDSRDQAGIITEIKHCTGISLNSN